MDLLSQLQAAATQSDWTVREDPKPKTRKKRMDPANAAKREYALAKYKAAMGDEWLQTQEIARRLKYASASCHGTLVAYEQLGFVERRPVGGAEKFNNRKGYEWRFK